VTSLELMREAERQALERDIRHSQMGGGLLRREPSMMENIGGAVADYAVPDRYSEAFNPSLILDRVQLNPNATMQDIPDMSPMLMDMMPQAGIGGVIKRVQGRVGKGVGSLPKRGGKYIGSPYDLKITSHKMPWIMGNFEQMAREGEKAWPWYFRGGGAFNTWYPEWLRKQAIDTVATMSPSSGVDLNSKWGVKGMNQWALGEPIHAGAYPTKPKGMLSPLFEGEAETLFDTVKAQKVPSFSANLQHGAGLPVSPEDMLRSTQDRWMAVAGNFRNAELDNNQYNYLSAITKDVAETLGILPHQAQAGVWTSIKARVEAVRPEIHAKYLKAGKMRKKMVKNEKTGKREPTGPWEITPEHSRKYSDEIFAKAMKADLPDSAFDEAGRSFDYFFNKSAKKYDAHSMDELSPFLNKEGRIQPWDAQGIPHRVSKGRVELLEPSFEGVADPYSLRQNEIAEALIRKLRGESGGSAETIERLGGTAGLERFLSGKPLLSPY